MYKVLKIFIVIALISTVTNGAAEKRKLLKDGAAVSGIDGRLVKDEAAGKWFFELVSELSDDVITLQVREKIELLPTSTLEAMVVSLEENPAGFVRLWGRVTKFADRNFIFSAYFLPLTTTGQKQPTSAEIEEEAPATPKVNESDDAVVIPEEVVGMMQKKRVVRVAHLQKALESEKDFVLADRMGYIAKPQDDDELAEFVFDALGRNFSIDLSPKLLPCAVLEEIKSARSKSLTPIRFKVAGIMTKYKGSRYILLQRASRTYSHGNFTR